VWVPDRVGGESREKRGHSHGTPNLVTATDDLTAIFAAAGGATQLSDITINAAAVITGTVARSVREKSGVDNGTAGLATVTGDLDATDVDSPATFVAQSNVATTYGTFSIDSAGTWTYTLDDNNANVQALNAGDKLHDLITAATADGTTQVIDITIKGDNDAAVITGTAARSVREKSGVDNGTAGLATVTSDLDATDVDSAATFVVQSNVATAYGTFSIDAAGTWTYTLDDNNANVQALNAGGKLHDLITVATADGTTKVIDITI
jgi:VCBS repeat-containing protein